MQVAQTASENSTCAATGKVSAVCPEEFRAYCYLLEMGSAKVLLECGWSSHFDRDRESFEAYVGRLRELAETVDFVLVSSAVLSFCGALPLLVSASGRMPPVYMTAPVAELAEHQCRNLHALASYDWIDQPDSLFYSDSTITTRFSEGVNLTVWDSPSTVAGCSFTAHPASFSIGSAVWTLSIEGAAPATYVPIYSQAINLSTVQRGMFSRVAAEEADQTPAAVAAAHAPPGFSPAYTLICDTSCAVREGNYAPVPPDAAARVLFSTLKRRSGVCMIPVDLGSTALEVLAILGSQITSMHGERPKVYFVCRQGAQLLAQMRCMREWLPTALFSAESGEFLNPDHIEAVDPPHRGAQDVEGLFKHFAQVSGDRLCVVVAPIADASKGAGAHFMHKMTECPENCLLIPTDGLGPSIGPGSPVAAVLSGARRVPVTTVREAPLTEEQRKLFIQRSEEIARAEKKKRLSDAREKVEACRIALRTLESNRERPQLSRGTEIKVNKIPELMASILESRDGRHSAAGKELLGLVDAFGAGGRAVNTPALTKTSRVVIPPSVTDHGTFYGRDYFGMKRGACDGVVIDAAGAVMSGSGTHAMDLLASVYGLELDPRDQETQGPRDTNRVSKLNAEIRRAEDRLREAEEELVTLERSSDRVAMSADRARRGVPSREEVLVACALAVVPVDGLPQSSEHFHNAVTQILKPMRPETIISLRMDSKSGALSAIRRVAGLVPTARVTAVPRRNHRGAEPAGMPVSFSLPASINAVASGGLLGDVLSSKQEVSLAPFSAVAVNEDGVVKLKPTEEDVQLAGAQLHLYSDQYHLGFDNLMPRGDGFTFARGRGSIRLASASVVDLRMTYNQSFAATRATVENKFKVVGTA